MLGAKSMAGEELTFGHFRLDLSRRTLSRDGAPVPLRGRPLDILCVLADAGGEVVTKYELMARIWAGRVVEENNIQVHVSALRKALGDGQFILTVPGRGYRLGEIAPRTAGQQGLRLPLPERPSIAVLPFANMSGDPEQDYFADGMVEDIITAMSRMRWLFVIARNSSFIYKGRSVDIKAVGAELGVRYVLEGSVRKASGQVRITCQLIDSSSGTHLWADRFDGALDDIFALQDQVTASVVGAIAPRLEQAEIERAKRKPTQRLDAYDYYLRGMASSHRTTRNDIDDALRLLARASELDPEFAAPHGLAALCYVIRKSNGWMADPAHEVAEAARHARRAASLDNEDAVALSFGSCALAFVTSELDDAAALADRSLALNPNLAFAWVASGMVRAYREGEHDIAIEHIGRAMRLSPFDPYTFLMEAIVAVAHSVAGRYEEAIVWAERALRVNPRLVGPLAVAAASYAAAGRQDEARNAIGRLVALDPGVRFSNIKNRIGPRPAADYVRFTEALRVAGLPE
jgi:TolB-like protein